MKVWVIIEIYKDGWNFEKATVKNVVNNEEKALALKKEYEKKAEERRKYCSDNYTYQIEEHKIL